MTISERMDYAAIKDGMAIAICSADDRPTVRDFYRTYAGFEIRLLPVHDAVELHRKWLSHLAGRKMSLTPPRP